MLDDDDLLRQMFEREARLVPYTSNAHAALASLEPALRRAAIKRTALIAASAVLTLGGGVAAFHTVRVPDAAVSVGARPLPADTVPAITAVPPATAPSATAPPATAADAATDTDDATTPRSAVSPVVTDDVDTAARTTVAPPSTAPSPAAPTTVRTVSPSPQPTVAPQPAPTTAAPATSTTPTPVTYDTECGVVVADLSTTPPTLLEVTPREDHEVHVEDPDHGRITVHFAGHDHECEIHVGAPATEEPHESHEANDGQSDD